MGFASEIVTGGGGDGGQETRGTPLSCQSHSAAHSTLASQDQGRRWNSARWQGRLEGKAKIQAQKTEERGGFATEGEGT